MAEPSEAAPPSPETRRRCPDCGNEYDVPNGPGATTNCCNACQVKRMTFVFTKPAPEAIPPPTEKKPLRRSRKLWFALLVLASAVTAGIVWRKPLHDQYRQWTQNMHARRAAQSLEKGDYARAILDGRKALEFDPLDVETNRVIAKACEAQNSFDAIPWRARLNLIKPGDVENALAWARGALNAGDNDAAEDALATLRPADRTSAPYHDLVAQLAMARDEIAEAELHWKEAARLDPSAEEFRLRLASIQVRTLPIKERAPALKTLETLAEKPKHRSVALRALIEEAMNRHDFPRACRLADTLVASPEARFGDRIGRLAMLRDQQAPEAREYLARLRGESLGNPVEFTMLLSWMNQHHLPGLVSHWVPELPAELTSRPPVALAIADAYGRGREWAKLKAHTEGASWANFEHVRLAQLARALENFGNVVAAETTWGRAVAECQERPERLAGLVRLAQAWRWEERAEVVLRKLSADEGTPVWMLDALWNMAKKSGDSAELHRLSRLIVKARPKNTIARNNFIRLSLLRRTNETVTNELAAALYRENPKDMACAITRALSLYFQNQVFEALQVMRAFPQEDLREPEPALYYGVFLYASGDAAGAGPFLEIAHSGKLLREEEDLIAGMKRDSRNNTLTLPLKKPAAPR